MLCNLEILNNNLLGDYWKTHTKAYFVSQDRRNSTYSFGALEEQRATASSLNQTRFWAALFMYLSIVESSMLNVGQLTKDSRK